MTRLLVAALIFLKGNAHAWGPHWDITATAIDALGTNHPLAAKLGIELRPLTNYCWLPDYKRLPFRTPEQDFYADDYLLFPGVTIHYDHLCPEVRKTFVPYFQRAMQALRTESPANAARWIGSLLHFVQDSGSPPHAIELRGDMHSKMENWIERNTIRLQGYEPRLLGTNDADVLVALLQRMDELIVFSAARGRKLLLPVQTGNRRDAEPMILECALECARVTADLLHTLGHLPDGPGGGAIEGEIVANHAVGPDRFPVKIVIQGARFSTLASSDGRFSFHDLPPGAWTVAAFGPAAALARTNVVVVAGRTTQCHFALTNSVNLVRNAEFKLHWTQPGAPDCWLTVSNAWESEAILLKDRQRYRVHAEFQSDAAGEVLVRWSKPQYFMTPRPARVSQMEPRTLSRTGPAFVFTADESFGLVHLTVPIASHPTNVVRRVSIVPINE